MALDAGLRSNLILGGICGVSGWLAFQEEYPAAFSSVVKQQHFLVTHGTEDPVLPYRASKVQSDFLIRQGLDLTFLTTVYSDYLMIHRSNLNLKGQIIRL